MPKERPLLPRDILARNLRALLARSTLSAPEVAKQARTDRKTFNNQLNARYDPRPEPVDAVARVFGLQGWMLLSPSFNPYLAQSNINRLLELFAEADQDGKESIIRVAELAARSRP